MGRKLGQHFLKSEHFQCLIAKTLDPSYPVLEIGPGKGALTQRIVEAGTKTLVVVELDGELIEGLKENYPGVEIVQGDILKVDIEGILRRSPRHPWQIVGNLPYYITSPILVRCLQEISHCSSQMVFMMQEEVARRICVTGERATGSLSYFLALYAQAEYLFKVPPGAFAPPPKVDSAVVRLVPHPEPLAKGEVQKWYHKIVRHVFGMRRKTLKKSLGMLTPHAPQALSDAEIDLKARPETLSVEQFLALARSTAKLHEG